MKRTHILNDIIYELYALQAAEFTRLARMTRKAEEHGCCTDFVEALRNEALIVSRANPEDLVNPFFLDRFTWAFKD